jgi:hypothetical protein
MDALELLRLNLTSPIVLGFALGIVGALVKGDLRLPDAVHSAIGSYLLLAIGLKGGAELARVSGAEIALPAAATLVAGTVVPLACFAVLRRLGKFSVVDAAAVAAHYGSVSIVTFTAASVFVESRALPFEGHLAALVAFLEVPGILVALALAQSARTGVSWRVSLHEVLASKSNLLLVGGILIGLAAGPSGITSVKPFFVDPFRGVLTLFMIDMGLIAASRLGDLRATGFFLVGFALIAPVVNGLFGAFLGTLAGLSVGGVTIFATMVASASYIAAPVAVRISLPTANPAYYLTSALGITFPFNLAVGIPLYHEFALWMHR